MACYRCAHPQPVLARRQRVGFCKACLSLLLVGGLFLAMYMYIKVTYMVGFKQ